MGCGVWECRCVTSGMWLVERTPLQFFDKVICSYPALCSFLCISSRIGLTRKCGFSWSSLRLNTASYMTKGKGENLFYIFFLVTSTLLCLICSQIHITGWKERYTPQSSVASNPMFRQNCNRWWQWHREGWFIFASIHVEWWRTRESRKNLQNLRAMQPVLYSCLLIGLLLFCNCLRCSCNIYILYIFCSIFVNINSITALHEYNKMYKRDVQQLMR